MILGIEIALLVMGIMAVANGKMKFTKNKVVEGLPARLLGVLAILTLPTVFMIGFIVGFMQAFQNPNGDPQEFIRKHAATIAIIEACIVGGVTIFIVGVGLIIGGPPTDERPRRRRRRDEEDDYDDDEYDDRPSRRPRRGEEDEFDDEEDERPSRRNRRDDDEYDDRPRRKNRREDDY